jgi:branched-chain amino acid transport system substrate-binding protein
MKIRSRRSLVQRVAGFLIAASLAAIAQAAEPVKIGFGMALTGPLSANGKSALLAMQIWEESPRPETIALAAADAEFGHNACEGARDNAKESGLKIVYDKSYLPATTDFAPVIRAVQSTKPDLFVICSYPLDSVGIIRAMHEVGFKSKMWGGAMVGPQSTAFKMQLGPLLNGHVTNDNWLPVKAMQFPGSMELLAKYQERAKGQGVDPLGYFIPVWAYSYLQLLQQAIEETKTFDEGQLADHMHKATFKLLVGDVRFTALGEWAEERPLTVQFQNIKGNSLEEVRDIAISAILYPQQYKSGNVIYPYENALK